MWRVRPSWSSTTLHLPYFQTTYGWVITRVPRACLLERWKSGDGRAWEISLVVLTLVSGTFRTAFSDIPFAHPLVISCRKIVWARCGYSSVRMRRPDKGGKRSFLFGSRSLYPSSPFRRLTPGVERSRSYNPVATTH